MRAPAAEPLNNYGAVLGATRALRELWELSPSRITVSTVGVVSKMRALARDAPGVSLALSLHAATQPTRKRLVPSASAYTLEKLMDAVDYYCALSGRGVMIEYILIPGVNDADDEAAALGALLRGRNVVLNLIPYNETSAGDAQGYTSPTNEQVRRFARVLTGPVGGDGDGGEDDGGGGGGGGDGDGSDDELGGGPGGEYELVGRGGLRVSVRWSSSFARDVDGACGQLALVTEASGRAGACTASDDIEDLAGAAPRPPSIVARAIGGLWGALAGAGASGGAGTELREAAAGEEPDGAAADGDAGDDMPISCPPTSPGMATPLTRQLRADGVPDALLPAYRRQAFEYSAADFGFARALCAALRQPDLNALEAAAPRNGSPCMPALQHALLCAGIALPAAERRAGAAGWMASAERAAFLGEYHAFVRRVVLPRLDALDGSGRLVYQAEPTLRISLPGSRAPGGKPRASCEHFHPPGELTFWVPLTHLAPASASRDMHVASEPGVDAPVEPLGLSAGQCASWWGHRLRSGFVGANETGASTVGFDFHVIPWRLYRESRADAKRSKDSLRLGGFYTVADVRAGAVPKPTDGSGTGAAEPNEPAELEGDTDGAPDSPVDAS